MVHPFDLSDGDGTGVTHPTPAAFPAGISIFHKGTPLIPSLQCFAVCFPSSPSLRARFSALPEIVPFEL